MQTQYSEMIPLHNALKEIVQDFQLLCRTIGVDFFLLYGTLLGAARHHDIIPWDDDIDLGMMRGDYEKLISHCMDHSVDGYKLFCAETSNDHTQIFAKLVRVDGKYDYLSKFYTHSKGLSIDIFPLDEAKPQSSVKQRIRGVMIIYLRRIVNSREKLRDLRFREPWFKRVVRLIAVMPFMIVDNHKLLMYTNNLCKKSNGKGYPNIINYSTTDKLCKENDPKESWFPPKKLPLGDDEYLVPSDYGGILMHIYGTDWKDIPPEYKREQHTHYEK